MGDRRFDRSHFAFQPSWLIRQAVDAVQQQRNLDQLTQARSNMLFCNANRGENTQPFEDIALFLPHPTTWIAATSDRVLDIDRATAIEFLRTYKRYPPSIEAAFDDWLTEIKLIADS